MFRLHSLTSDMSAPDGGLQLQCEGPAVDYCPPTYIRAHDMQWNLILNPHPHPFG